MKSNFLRISLLIVCVFSNIYTVNAQSFTKQSSVQIKEELRSLIDTYASLGDEKNISEQMKLFTPDATYKVYMNGAEVINISGSDKIEQEFLGHASQVKTYFTLNGQHTVELNKDSATGLSNTQIKMVREAQGKDVLTDYSVRYKDYYVYKQGKWLIKDRVAYFIIVEARILTQ